MNTESHRQCRTCKQYHPIREYRTYKDRPGCRARVCRECQLARKRDTYAHLPEEQLVAINARTSADERRRRERRHRARLKDARDMIEILERQGMSRGRVADVAGVRRVTVYRLMAGTRRYPRPSTIEKLYAACVREVGGA